MEIRSTESTYEQRGTKIVLYGIILLYVFKNLNRDAFKHTIILFNSDTMICLLTTTNVTLD